MPVDDDHWGEMMDVGDVAHLGVEHGAKHCEPDAECEGLSRVPAVSRR